MHIHVGIYNFSTVTEHDVMTWVPKSLDLNPIEQFWDESNRRV